jgi:hypothetical protein
MESSLRPQPLISEILPGLTVISLAVASSQYGSQIANLLKSQNAGWIAVAGAGVILGSWIVGTALDSVRNIFEELIDWKIARIDWEFLFKAPAEDIRKLEDSFLAYYFLDGNYVVGFLLLTLLTLTGAIALWWWIPVVFLVIFGLDAVSLRKEIKKLVDDFNRSRPSQLLPHEGLFARMRPSKVDSDGVGVFAIRDIPKGTYVFEPDDDEMAWIDKSVADALPGSLREMYEDFPVLRNGKYGCPPHFNRMTIAWYVNSSKTPNLKCDADYRFYASRDIKADEELTADYDEYSDPVS